MNALCASHLSAYYKSFLLQIDSTSLLNCAMAEASTSSDTLNSKMENPEKEFTQVKRKSRKRKLKDENNTGSGMDTSETDAKRPTFPAISGEKLMVTIFDHTFVMTCAPCTIP